MQRAHPEEYSFVPQTWVLPAEYPLSTYQLSEDLCNLIFYIHVAVESALYCTPL